MTPRIQAIHGVAMERAEQLLVKCAVRLLRLPDPLLQVIAGRPITIDGHRLSPTSQMLLRMERLVFRRGKVEPVNVHSLRENYEFASAQLSKGFLASPRTTDILIPSPAGSLRVRVHRPTRTTVPRSALVYFHGGGFVMGSVQTHDAICQFLAENAGSQVLSVDYRLAPEHPFPRAVDDAIGAFSYIANNSDRFGVSPTAVAVGGDSAGAALAAAVSHAAIRNGSLCPAVTFLLYPPTDAAGRHRSRDLFNSGFFLDEEVVNWYRSQYLPYPSQYNDPRASFLRETALEGLPPTYVATAGADPLRDEGEAYVELLRRSGVRVRHRRHSRLLHGFANFFAVDPHARDALLQAAAALQDALTASTRNIGSA